MKLYPYQIEIIDALHAGNNVVRAGSRRVGLTTAALAFIEEKVISGGKFRAVIHTRNMRSLLYLIAENKHHLPLSPIWDNGLTSSSAIEVSNTSSPVIDFELYDDVNIPNRPIHGHWALVNTHGICKLPKNIHMPFIFMDGVRYMHIQ